MYLCTEHSLVLQIFISTQHEKNNIIAIVLCYLFTKQAFVIKKNNLKNI